jgi:hypothetical protein
MQLNAAPFLGAIQGVQRSVRNFAALTAGLTGAFFAARAAMAGFTSVAMQMKGALDLGGRLSDLSAATGATVSELVLLRQAFQNAGLGVEAVGPMVARFQKALAGVNEDGQTTGQVLETIGLNTLALSRMSLEDQFVQLSKAFSSIEDPAERTAMAMKIFGRSGAEMLAIFRDPQAFATAAAQVGDLGGVLEANAARFDSISDAIGAAQTKLDQFFAGFMSEVSGLDGVRALAETDFTGFGQALGAAARSVGEMMASLRAVLPVIATFGAALLANRLGLTDTIVAAGTRVPAAMGTLSGAFSSAASRIAATGAVARTVLNDISAQSRAAAASAAALPPITVNIGASFRAMQASVVSSMAAIRAQVQTSMQAVGTSAASGVASARAAFAQIPQAIASAFATASTSARAAFSAVSTSAQSSFSATAASARAAASAVQSAFVSAGTAARIALANPQASAAALASATNAAMGSALTSGRTAAAGIAAAFRVSLAQTRAEFGVLAGIARGAFASMATAARTAGAAMKGALISTGIGAAVVAIGMAVEAVMAKFNRLQEGTRSLQNVGNDMARSLTSNATRIRSVASEDDRASVAADLDTQIEETRRRVSGLADEFENISPQAFAEIESTLGRQLNLLQRQREILSNLSPEIIAANAEEKRRAEALAQSKRNAEELAKELERAGQERDSRMDQRGLEAMPAAEAEGALLQRAGASGLESLQAYIAKQRERGNLTDAEKQRLLELYDLEEQILAVQKRKNEESRQQTEQDTRLTNAREALALENERIAAEASGDAQRVRQIETEQRTRQTAAQLVSDGMTEAEARAVAEKQAELQNIATDAQQQTQRDPLMVSDAQRAIGLGGNFFAEQRRPQEEMVRRQADANRLLADIKTLLGKQGPRVLLAETFD